MLHVALYGQQTFICVSHEIILQSVSIMSELNGIRVDTMKVFQLVIFY